MNQTEQYLSQLPGNPWKGLLGADALWSKYKSGNREVPSVVEESSQPMDTHIPGENSAVLQQRSHSPSSSEQDNHTPEPWDVVICGGTLGILLGAALAQQGWRVALVERGILRGRAQEWNISRRELSVLVELGLLSEAALEEAIASEYNPARLAFHEGPEFWVKDVLNVGVAPITLLEQLKQTFLTAGGTLLENTAFVKATVCSDGVAVTVRQQNEQQDELKTLPSRLVIDAMGHFSPIAVQARKGRSPDAVCMVVGTCATGFPQNDTGDLFASFTPVQDQRQYFWEAFPARDGRTTYLFTYLDAHPSRPSLVDLFEDYWRLLPTYQQVEIDQLQLVRALFGFFPCFRDSPLQLPWSRMLAVGDSSGNQSPLSFGGFGAMIRHLPRLTRGIHEALTIDALDPSALALLQPYQPNLSVTWLFQKSMSVGVNQALTPNQINGLLSAVFQEMDQLGLRTLKPFLQDVVQFSGLFNTLARTTVFHPQTTLKVMPQVGIMPLVNWIVHYAALAGYTGLGAIAPLLKDTLTPLSPTQRYYVHRWMDAWIYGAGLDHTE